MDTPDRFMHFDDSDDGQNKRKNSEGNGIRELKEERKKIKYNSKVQK